MSPTASFRYASLALILGALAHIVGHIIGPEAVGFMGAPLDVVQGSRDGTWLYFSMLAAIICLLLGLSYLAWKKEKAPFARLLLWLFALIFTLRGLLFIFFVSPAIKGNFGPSPAMFWFHLFASLFVLSIGLTLGLGLWKTRKSI